MRDILLGAMLLAVSSVAAPVRAGKLKVLAVAGERRLAALPGIPAVAETLPGFVSKPWFGMVGPPKMPAVIASKLSGAIAETMKLPDVVKLTQDLSVEAVGSTPAEMAQHMKQEVERWGAVIRTTGAKAE